MPFKKETRHLIPPRGPGKLAKTVKETVLAVFNDIQDDKKANLLNFAKENPKEFYQIAAKLIPTEVSAVVDSKINIHIVRGKSNTE